MVRSEGESIAPLFTFALGDLSTLALDLLGYLLHLSHSRDYHLFLTQTLHDVMRYAEYAAIYDRFRIHSIVQSNVKG